MYSAMTKKERRRLLIRAMDPADLNKAADAIKVVGHPDRLRILEFLEDGEKRWRANAPTTTDN